MRKQTTPLKNKKRRVEKGEKGTPVPLKGPLPKAQDGGGGGGGGGHGGGGRGGGGGGGGGVE